MKQLLQFPGGETRIEEVAAPGINPGALLIRTEASLVSIGTERMVVDFAKKSLLAKARARPDLVRKVIDKARTEGVLTAVQATRARLDQPMPLGYSASGTVIGVGSGVQGFNVGDRVAAAGAGHAEVISVPQNLAARVPAGVPPEAAAFATVAAIGLHGIRIAEAQIGSQVAVVGLGLIGLLTVQMARAAGLRVLGVDVDAERVARAETLGAEVAVTVGSDDVPARVSEWTDGRGVDAVLLTASTASSDPIELAAEISRDRGRVVAVGAVGMQVPRRPFYMKELDLKISRSYGPGRYDPVYEKEGVDYPVGYVRWTEQRNLEAVLDLMAKGALHAMPLVSHRMPIARALEIYDGFGDDSVKPLGVLLTYPRGERAVRRRIDLVPGPVAPPAGERVGVGLVGAGLFATRTLLPALKSVERLQPIGVCTTSGASGRHAGDKFGFRYATTEVDELLSDDDVDCILIATRHDLHADQVVQCLEAGKHVFVEKPLALDLAGLERIAQALENRSDRILMVGFNRRFAPMVVRLKEFFGGVTDPLMVHYRVNAGALPEDHWLHDPKVGGGRIVGEACHFLDLGAWLTDSMPTRVRASSLPSSRRFPQDNVSIQVDMEDGSLLTVTYLANGHQKLGKERIEVSGGGQSAVLDDFRSLSLFGPGKPTIEKDRLRQDKGHQAELQQLAETLHRGGPSPTSLASVAATTLVSLAAVRSLQTGSDETIGYPSWDEAPE